MIATILVIAAFCLGVGVLVLRANPRRFANHVFVATSAVTALWLLCVTRAIWTGQQFFFDGVSSPVFWLRADVAVAAFFPWLTWLLGDAICATHPSRRSLLRSLPLGALSLLCAAACWNDELIPADSTPMHQVRGPVYDAVCFVGLVAYALIILDTTRRMRRQVGLRRVEMQYLTLNLAITYPLVILVTSVGNAIGSVTLKESCFLILLASFCLSGWALTFHRIYDARQIVLSLGQRLVVLLALAFGIWNGAQVLARWLPSPADSLVSAFVCGVLILFFDRKSRQWLDLGGERRLVELRTDVTDLSRTEPNLDQLVLEFERLIRVHSGATFAALLADHGAVFARGRLELPKDCVAYGALIETGWATPESLDRRRTGSGTSALQEFLTEHSLGLMVAVPSGSPNPSLVVALGINRTRWPFTYPEVQRIREVAVVMDHILVRSRLAADQALKTKLDHLAMMSRGLAHDLKNLITPISSFLVHTHGRSPPGSAEAEVHSAARRSVAIITEYISESLFFSNQLTPRFETVLVPDVVAIVAEITQTRAARRGIAIIVHAAGDDGFDADVVLVQRMLVNLVNNAIDASLAGANILVTAGPRGTDWMRFQVKDDGVGIPPEHTARVFEPYFTTKQFGDDIRGFGLGLTICDKIVALHGGRISLESSVGVGTTVTIDLPARQRVRAAATRRPRLGGEPTSPTPAGST